MSPLGYSLSQEGPFGNDLDSTPNQTTGVTPSFVVTQGQTLDYIDAGRCRRARIRTAPPASATTSGSTPTTRACRAPSTPGRRPGRRDGRPAAGRQQRQFQPGRHHHDRLQRAYSFDSLNAGTYEFQFVAPNGYAFSPQGPQGSDLDSTPNQSTGITQPITLATGQAITWADAGLYQPAALGDYVWLDVNNNGIQDSGETGVAGVTVNLENATGTTVLATTTTDANGLYHFTGLAPGLYDVQFVAPAGDSVQPGAAGRQHGGRLQRQFGGADRAGDAGLRPDRQYDRRRPVSAGGAGRLRVARCQRQRHPGQRRARHCRRHGQAGERHRHDGAGDHDDRCDGCYHFTGLAPGSV